MPFIHYSSGNIHAEGANRKVLLYLVYQILAWKERVAHFIRDFLVYNETISYPSIKKPIAS